jgi:hypothetical protein
MSITYFFYCIYSDRTAKCMHGNYAFIYLPVFLVIQTPLLAPVFPQGRFKTFHGYSEDSPFWVNKYKCTLNANNYHSNSCK